jgi:hypothetical protein
MNERMKQMEGEMQDLRAELQAYRDRVLPAVTDIEHGTGNQDQGSRN